MKTAEEWWPALYDELPWDRDDPDESVLVLIRRIQSDALEATIRLLADEVHEADDFVYNKSTDGIIEAYSEYFTQRIRALIPEIK